MSVSKDPLEFLAHIKIITQKILWKHRGGAPHLVWRSQESFAWEEFEKLTFELDI